MVSVIKWKCFVVMSVLLVLLYTMKNRGQKVASYSHKFYSQSAPGVALLYSASSFKLWKVVMNIVTMAIVVHACVLAILYSMGTVNITRRQGVTLHSCLRHLVQYIHALMTRDVISYIIVHVK